MVSLARANLIHDWRRHVTAIIILVLVGLLINTQLGLMTGFVEAQGELQRQLPADLIVKPKPIGLGAGSGFQFGNRGIDSRHQARIWIHPDVEVVQPYSSGQHWYQWRKEDQSTEYVQLKITDPNENSMTYPHRFPDSLRKILNTPGYAVITAATARKLQVQVGDQGTLNRHKVTVGAVVSGMPSGFMIPVFVSSQTARLFGAAANDKWPQNFLIRLKPDTNRDRVVVELNQMLSPVNLEVIPPEDFASALGLKELLTSSFGWILMGSSAFALVVGCGIASQTLRGAFLAQLKEFGSLRALGVSRMQMAGIAMEQACLTGLAAVPVTAILAHGLRVLAMQFDLVIALPNKLLLATSILLLFVAIIAGVISLTAVTRVEPAELLR